MEPWRGYIAARFVDDPHLPAVTLLDELAAAGFQRSYPTLVRELRRTALRPVCLVCQQRRGKAPTTEIDHPPGEEIQWDWLELHTTPWEQPAFVLVGALSHSGRFRAVFCEQMTFGYLAGALHEILVGLGGTSLVWRVDRMATAVIPESDTFAKCSPGSSFTAPTTSCVRFRRFRRSHSAPASWRPCLDAACCSRSGPPTACGRSTSSKRPASAAALRCTGASRLLDIDPVECPVIVCLAAAAVGRRASSAGRVSGASLWRFRLR